MRYQHWILSCTLTLLALAGPALAKPGQGRSNRSDIINPEHIDRLADKLELRDNLRVEIKAIATQAKLASIDLRAAQKKAQLKMKVLMDQPEPPRAVIMSQIEAIGALHTKLRKLKTGALLDIRAKLTPAQRTQLKKMRRKFRKRTKRRGKRKGDRRGKRRNSKGDIDGSPETPNTPSVP